MRFSVRFRIGGRFGAISRYSLRDFCVSLVDRYSLSEAEVLAVVTLPVGTIIEMSDLWVRRDK